MATNLRIDTFRVLIIDQRRLSPKLGCGLILAQIPKFHGSDAFHKVLSGYKVNNIYADKSTQKLFQTEKIVQRFCENALSAVPLNENFRSVFSNHQLILLSDLKKESAWFVGDVENRLPFQNYYKDVVPNILKELGIIMTGSYARLMPIGWQNIFDVIDESFTKSYPEIKCLEIQSVLTDARVRNHVLSIGINLLNLTSPETIRQKILCKSHPLLGEVIKRDEG